MKTEREILIEFRDAGRRLETAETAAKDAQSAYDQAEKAVVEFLESKTAKATAKYEGIGYAGLVKPRLYANCKNENEEDLFFYLTQIGRGDLIKPKVHPSTLSGFVKELVEGGREPPKFISYYFKTTVRLYE